MTRHCRQWHAIITHIAVAERQHPVFVNQRQPVPGRNFTHSLRQAGYHQGTGFFIFSQVFHRIKF